MLIQKIVGAARAQFIQSTFGLGPAEPGPVGIGLLHGLLSLAPLPEPLQVDQIPHGALLPNKRLAGENCTRARAVILEIDLRGGHSKKVPLVSSDNIKEYL
jgi:hypothetical protein